MRWSDGIGVHSSASSICSRSAAANQPLHAEAQLESDLVILDRALRVEAPADLDHSNQSRWRVSCARVRALLIASAIVALEDPTISLTE